MLGTGSMLGTGKELLHIESLKYRPSYTLKQFVLSLFANVLPTYYTGLR